LVNARYYLEINTCCLKFFRTFIGPQYSFDFSASVVGKNELSRARPPAAILLIRQRCFVALNLKVTGCEKKVASGPLNPMLDFTPRYLGIKYLHVYEVDVPPRIFLRPLNPADGSHQKHPGSAVARDGYNV